MISYQVQQNKLEGEKQIIFNMKEEHKKNFKKAAIAEYEAYIIDIVVTSNKDGKLNLSQHPTRVLKCTQTNNNLQLKLETSLKFAQEARKNFKTFPFSLRQITNERMAKMGSLECIRNRVAEPYSVLSCKAGDYVAQFMFTALVMKEETIAVVFPKDPTINAEHILA